MSAGLSIFSKFKRILESWYPWSGYASRGRLSNEVLYDDESEGWIQIRRDAHVAKNEYINETTYDELREISRYLYLTNVHYRGILRTYRKYVAGKRYEIKGENDQQDEIWKEFQKKVKWRRFFKEMVLRFFRDGEVFIHLPFWQFLDPEKVRNPGPGPDFGIAWDENNQPEYYTVMGETDYLKIPADEILHFSETDSDEKRGIPYLFPLMTKTRTYDKWLNDRVLLNRIRASIAIIRKHKTSSSNISTFADSKVTSGESPKTTRYGESVRKRIFEPGTIIDCSDKTDYQFLEPKIRAQDVAQDGRSLRLTFSAMTSLPEFMITGDASNSNYASTMVSEGPAIREFEDWQDFFIEVIEEIWDEVMAQARMQATDPQITPPPLVARDREKDTKSNEILHEHGVISVEEWRRRESLDSDKMQEEINGAEL